MKVLVELRPALDGHAGIPQEARLLFQGLLHIDGIEPQGLIQSSDRFLPEGLPNSPVSDSAVSTHEQIDRLSRVIVSLQPRAVRRHFVARVWSRANTSAAFAALVIRRLLGRREALTWFDPVRFRDFVWRALFAKTLPVVNFEEITTARYRIAQAPYGLMHACGLVTLRLGCAVYPRLDTRCVDAMLVMTPYPATVSEGTRLIVRYFDAVPLIMPHMIINKARHQALHYQSLRCNVASGAYFVCCSNASLRDLLAVFPEVASRAVTIHCMVSHHYFLEDSSPSRVLEIAARRPNSQIASASVTGACRKNCNPPEFEYLLTVSTLEPRKNHITLVEAWEQLRRDGHPQLKLIVVGSLGWDYEPIVERMQLWIDQGDVLPLAGVPADELRVLYRHARATVCPSYAEGFGYAGVEAMRCGGVVVASDIPVHREIYDAAADYFNPYDVDDMAKAISRTIGTRGLERRRELLTIGAVVSERFLPDRVLPQWRQFLQDLC